MEYDFLYELGDGIATLTFNRPEVMNALTFEVYAQLRDLFERLRYDQAVRVVVLTGAGDNFCSGGDVHQIIGELLKRDMKGHLEFTRMTGAVVQNMRLLDKPIIAALNGMTAGAGSVIALASDLRIASEKARFAFLFTKVGLTGADMGAGYLLPRVVGMGRAFELLLLGDTIDAATALAWGLINRVVASEKLDEEVQSFVDRILARSGAAIALGKSTFYSQIESSLTSAYGVAGAAMTSNSQFDDATEGIDAFLTKRPPFWRNS